MTNIRTGLWLIFTKFAAGRIPFVFSTFFDYQIENDFLKQENEMTSATSKGLRKCRPAGERRFHFALISRDEKR